MVTLFVGIDPGLKGAIATLYGNGEIYNIQDMPVVDGQVSAILLSDTLKGVREECDRLVIAVERVASMPKQGVASTFKFGAAYGIALGVAASVADRLYLPPPSRWKRAMGLSSDKEHARRRAIERWPKHADLFKLKKHADRAEAALLAAWMLGAW